MRTDSCRVRLELPERVTGTEFGLEIKINDASGDRIADRSALLFGAEFAYRDRLVFGIVKEDDAELPASSAVSGKPFRPECTKSGMTGSGPLT